MKPYDCDEAARDDREDDLLWAASKVDRAADHTPAAALGLRFSPAIGEYSAQRVTELEAENRQLRAENSTLRRAYDGAVSDLGAYARVIERRDQTIDELHSRIAHDAPRGMTTTAGTW